MTKSRITTVMCETGGAFPMNKRPFIKAIYKGKPAVYDTVARVFYTGYRSHMEAVHHANALNNGE